MNKESDLWFDEDGHPICAKCDRLVSLRDSSEHDGLCDSCAHEEVARLRGIVESAYLENQNIHCSTKISPKNGWQALERQTLLLRNAIYTTK